MVVKHFPKLPDNTFSVVIFADKQPLTVFKSQRVVLPDGVAPASVVTRNGKIIAILPYNNVGNELGNSDE